MTVHGGTPARATAGVGGRLSAMGGRVARAGGGIAAMGGRIASAGGRRLLVLATVLAVLGGGGAVGVAALGGSDGIRVTAYFDRAVGVYRGSDLRVLGVKVGTVHSVEPRGKQVRVTLDLDHGVTVPARAGAVVVAPSVVADRYVQLTPAYTGGPRLTTGAVIPSSRTATPVEIDQLYDSITRLSQALGPDGANATGALSALLDTGAKNLDGNGKAIGDSIDQLGKAAKTLDGHRGDLFDTLSYLQSFTSMLKENDGKIRAAAEQLSTVTGFLADDKANLGGALRELSTALEQVKTFIGDNRARLRTSVDKLAPITRTLADQRASLAELLDTAPLAADNLLNAYDPAYGTIDGRADLNELSMGPATTPHPAASGTSSPAPGSTSSRTSSATPSGPGAAAVPRTAALPLPLPPAGTVYGGDPAPTKGAAR